MDFLVSTSADGTRVLLWPNLAQLWIWFMMYSVIGWLWEVALSFLQGRGFVNRGFLNGPYCPVYGTGALLVVHLLGGLTNPLLIFLAAAVITTTLEYLTSYVMEKLFDGRWWDYSDKPLNINSRVYATGSIAFGSLSLLVIRFVQPWFSRLTALLNPALLYVVAGGSALIVSLDLTHTVIQLIDFKHLLSELHRLSATHPLDRIEDSRLVRFLKKRRSQSRRWLHAFPRIRFDKLEQGLKRLKEFLEDES
ncbi:MAG: putative ABC transporter permease [Spirochaetales bacterium]|nr:putative ABC transporter permease [Spirochaetales bacterium]